MTYAEREREMEIRYAIKNHQSPGNITLGIVELCDLRMSLVNKRGRRILGVVQVEVKSCILAVSHSPEVR